MIKERREHFRYPTWLPGTVNVAAGETGLGTTTEVRIVDWSMGGASIDGILSDLPAGPLTLRVEWGGLSLHVAATIVATVAGEAGGEFPITHIRFEHLTPAQELEIAALVGAKAAAFKEGQRGLLQYLASSDG